MKKYTHESEELNALLGKRVRIKFFDDDVLEGVLGKSMFRKNLYRIDHNRGALTFRKSHVKKIEVIACR